MDTEFLTKEEAADWLRMKETTLMSLVLERDIPYRRHTTRGIVFNVEDLRRWSETKREGMDEQPGDET